MQGVRLPISPGLPKSLSIFDRHCEERSDEAIASTRVDRHGRQAGLAMIPVKKRGGFLDGARLPISPVRLEGTRAGGKSDGAASEPSDARTRFRACACGAG